MCNNFIVLGSLAIFLLLLSSTGSSTRLGSRVLLDTPQTQSPNSSLSFWERTWPFKLFCKHKKYESSTPPPTITNHDQPDQTTRPSTPSNYVPSESNNVPSRTVISTTPSIEKGPATTTTHEPSETATNKHNVAHESHHNHHSSRSIPTKKKTSPSLKSSTTPATKNNSYDEPGDRPEEHSPAEIAPSGDISAAPLASMLMTIETPAPAPAPAPSLSVNEAAVLNIQTMSHMPGYIDPTKPIF